MAQRDRVCVLGDGGWGTTLAMLLASKGYPVRLWGAFPAYVEEMRKRRENVKFLPGFKLPEALDVTADLGAAYTSDVVVLAVPSQYVRGVVKRLDAKLLRRVPLVIVAKGIETRTLCTMSQAVRQELGRQVALAVLSGPTIARDVALKYPAAASVASKDRRLASRVRTLFETEHFALFENDDVLGVELGGSLKNVLAIAAGMLQGMGLGANTRAVLFARGTAEMARLGVRTGARRETFMGLSGLGDLATTCLSPHSRNRWLGEEVGKGKKLKDVLRQTEMVVEGVDTAVSAAALAKKLKVAMPITEAVHGILFKNRPAATLIPALMQRKPVRESE